MNRPFLLIFAALVSVAGPSAAASNVSDEFYSAIRNNNLARLDSLIKGGADVNTRDRHGETALMYAAYVGSLDAMKLLLKDGASVDAQSQSGATALIWAATDLAKVRLLIDHGANVNLATKRRRTALLVAAMSDPSAEIVKLLIEKGADPKAVDFLKTTPLRAATLGNDTETIRMLIDAGVDVNAADLPGITPLMMAAGWNGNTRAVAIAARQRSQRQGSEQACDGIAGEKWRIGVRLPDGADYGGSVRSAGNDRRSAGGRIRCECAGRARHDTDYAGRGHGSSGPRGN